MTVAAPIFALPDDVSVAARAAFEAGLGRALAPSDLARLRRLPNGSFEAIVYEPHISRSELGEHVDHPWRLQGGMGKTAKSVSIRDAVTILFDPTSGDAEVSRREALFEAYQRERQAMDEAARARDIRDEIAAREQRQREQRAFEQHRGNEWGAAPVTAKLAYTLALAVDDGANLAAELRRLGGIIERTNTLPFPGRRWW